MTRFSHHCIKLTMECISIVSYQFLVNGALSEIIKPSRGLRQRDPFLFTSLYSAKTSCLNSSLQLKHKEIHGIKINRGSPPLSHLLFVDNFYVFFRISVHSYRKLKEVLNEFCKHLSMKINFSKSELFISQNCKMQKKSWFCGILGVGNAATPFKQNLER